MWAKYLRGPSRLASTEVPAPDVAELGPGQVLVRLLAGGLCGSDGPFYRGARNTWTDQADRPPGFPMHELVGEVVGSNGSGHAVGDRVVGWATGLDGLQELVVTDGESLHRYDASLHPAEAIMIQPLACVIYAVERIGDVQGKHCAVIGQGPIGVLFSHVLKAAGAAMVTGVDRIDRRQGLAAFGVDDPVFDSSGHWAHGLTGDEQRPEVVVEAVGHQVTTFGDAVDAVRQRGLILYFGVPDDSVYPLPMERFLRKHLTLIACSTLDRRRVLAAADAYVQAHPDLVKRFVTHKFPLVESDDAYEAAFTPKSGQFKVVIDVHG